jgi:tetratricopeptide (TPR) repeat protein
MKIKPGDKISYTKDNFLKYYILLAVIAFAVYANSLSNDFVFDDESVVLGDPTITQLSSIPEYFTGQAGFHKVIGRYYRPVVSSSYALDYALWGINPFGFHLTNVIIHVINTLLVFKLLLLIFGITEYKNSPGFYAVLLGTAIFAVHPVHTEAVTWISGRTDSLSFTFFAAAFIYYLKYSESASKKNLSFMIFYYVLSLLAKEMAITLPAVIILYDLIVKRISMSAIRNKFNVYGTLVFISILYLIFRWLILRNVPERETYFYFYGKDAVTTFFTMLQTIPVYLRLMFVPVGLLYHYSGYMPYVNSIGNMDVLFALFLIILLGWVSLFFLKRLPLITYCVLFFFVTLLPVMNIVPTMNFMAERFLYIPSLVVSIALIVFFLKYYSERTKNYFFSGSIAIILFFGFLTVERNPDWKTNDSLFLSAEGRPGTVLYVNIGNIYANRNELDKAETYYRKALDLRSELVLANNNLGKVFLIRGNFDSAYYYMNKAHLLDTLSPEPEFALAQLYMKFDSIPEAIKELEKIQQVTPNYMNSAVMLAQLKMKMQEGDITNKSNETVDRVAYLEQKSYNDYKDKKYSDAIADLKELVRINPVVAYSYYNNLGMCYKDMNKLDDAKKYFELSISEKKDFSTGYNNLGSVYEQMGDISKAKESYMKALETDPNSKAAKFNLDRLK